MYSNIYVLRNLGTDIQKYISFYEKNEIVESRENLANSIFTHQLFWLLERIIILLQIIYKLNNNNDSLLKIQLYNQYKIILQKSYRYIKGCLFNKNCITPYFNRKINKNNSSCLNEFKYSFNGYSALHEIFYTRHPIFQTTKDYLNQPETFVFINSKIDYKEHTNLSLLIKKECPIKNFIKNKY